MKLFYLEHDLYPATYNFKDDVVGDTGTDISFVENTTDAANQVLVASVGTHRKVLRTIDDAAYTEWNNVFSKVTDATIEFWFYTNDAGAVHTRVYIREDATSNYHIRFRNDELQNSAGGKLADISDSTWYHLRMEWESAGNTISIWLDGTSVLAAAALDANIVAGINYFVSPSYTNDAGVYFYFDAIGYSWDTDYVVGDNINVDWHDPYNKERITDIIEYPVIVPQINMYALCNTILGDFEGAKFDDWYARDFNKILIEDDDDNIIFRGFLIKKAFTKESLTLYFAGIGAYLDYCRFGDMGVMNYILAYGLVAAPIPATSILTLKDDDGNPFVWDVDWWIMEGMDVGLLIVDSTAITPITWDSSAIAQNGGTVQAGNNASTLTFMDDDYYNVRDSGDNFDLIITPTIDGVVIADTNSLKSIEVQYNYRLKVSGTGGWTKAKLHFEILKDTEWIPIGLPLSARRILGSHTTNWRLGVPLKIDGTGEIGGNDNQWYSPDEGDDTELQKYFNKDNGNYDELKGMRFRVTGHRDDVGYAEAHIDFIKVIVGYHGDDVAPIMEPVTDSAASTATCDSIAKWDETGVIENDSFKIGQNTRVILQDIATQSGLEIETRGTSSDGSFTLRPNGDGALTEWEFDNSGGDGNHYKDVDEVVVYPNAGDGNVVKTTSAEGVEERFHFETDVLGGGQVVTKIELNTYYKRDTAGCLCSAAFYTTSTGWSGFKHFTGSGSYMWKKFIWDGLALSQADLDSLQITYVGSDIPPIEDYVYIDTCYIVASYGAGLTIFDKYMAREFKGAYCMEPLKAVCKLEGCHWYEDYIRDKIIVFKNEDVGESGVELTEEDYDNWEYEDDCNQVKSFIVFGKSEDNIIAKATDETVKSPISKHLIDESITNIADAQAIADDQLALLNSKRPNIRLPLKADDPDLQIGYMVDVTFARPTIAKVAYIIRKLERKRRGIGDIALTIWIGLGESTAEENVAKFIRDNMFRSHKGLTNKLISP